MKRNSSKFWKNSTRNSKNSSKMSTRCSTVLRISVKKHPCYNRSSKQEILFPEQRVRNLGHSRRGTKGYWLYLKFRHGVFQTYEINENYYYFSPMEMTLRRLAIKNVPMSATRKGSALNKQFGVPTSFSTYLTRPSHGLTG